MTRTRSITFRASATVLVLAAVAVAGCGSSGGSNAGGSSAPPKTANGQSATVGVANDNLGKILIDSHGRTLYLFQRDSGTKSACTGACAIDWPPLRATGKPTVGSGAAASSVAISARSDGKPQVTYNGHPLYLFSGDQKPGDTNGEGVNAFGGLWYALSSAGNEIVGSTPNSGISYP
jgi:predicted lipoprotein with Yx(FWY)xxD motif